MPYNVQSSSSDATVKVNAGTCHDTGEPQTGFIISQPEYPNDHQRVVIDVNGDEVYNDGSFLRVI